jgi:hypothetical protein
MLEQMPARKYKTSNVLLSLKKLYVLGIKEETPGKQQRQQQFQFDVRTPTEPASPQAASWETAAPKVSKGMLRSNKRIGTTGDEPRDRERSDIRCR